MNMPTAPKVSVMDVKVGDKVGRDTGKDGAFGTVMWLTVTDVTDTEIRCNAWRFDRESGAEIDDDLQWGPEYGKTGSYITMVKRSEVAA